MPGIKWTKSQEQYLKDNFIDKTCEEIGLEIGKTTKAVQHKFNKLGLERPSPQIDDKINRLTIKDKFLHKHYNQQKMFAKVECECGKIIDKVLLTSIIQGTTKSCGCYKSDIQRERAIERNYVHGFSKDEHKRLFSIWLGAKYRCFDPKSPDYIKYGARGIKVVNEWLTYENFRDWSLLNGYSQELTLDRIDSNYHYSPDNCRWATLKQQVESKYNNRQILAFNEVKSLLHWIRDPRCKNDIETIKKRLSEGVSTEDAISQPKNPAL